MLPPTGAAGVVSLNPCPAPSVTTTTRFAAEAGTAARRKARKRRRIDRVRLALFRAGRGGGLRGRARLGGGVRAVHAALLDGAVGSLRGDRVVHRVLAELHHRGSVRKDDDARGDGSGLGRAGREELRPFGGGRVPELAGLRVARDDHVGRARGGRRFGGGLLLGRGGGRLRLGVPFRLRLRAQRLFGAFFARAATHLFHLLCGLSVSSRRRLRRADDGAGGKEDEQGESGEAAIPTHGGSLTSGVSGRGPYPTRPTRSISTRAPAGSAATATVVRAGR